MGLVKRTMGKALPRLPRRNIHGSSGVRMPVDAAPTDAVAAAAVRAVAVTESVPTPQLSCVFSGASPASTVDGPVCASSSRSASMS